MTQERRNTLTVTLGGLWMGFICSYGIITVGSCWIFSIGVLIGALLLLSGMWKILHWKKEKED